MAEAITALSLAANVVQFIDFATKVTTTFWDFYKSSSNIKGDIPNVTAINTDLQGILASLDAEPKPAVGGDVGLQKLTGECRKTATRLDEIMKPLLAAQSQSKGKQAALKAAFSSVWKAEEIQGLRQQLEEFRNQLVLHLLASLR
jgi:hypothetical protein